MGRTHLCGAPLFQPIHGLALQRQSRAYHEKAERGDVCVFVGKGGGGRRADAACLHVERSRADTPHKHRQMCERVREGRQLGETQPVLAGSPIPHWQLSHGTETPPALWKVELELFLEQLLGRGAHASLT